MVFSKEGFFLKEILSLVVPFSVFIVEARFSCGGGGVPFDDDSGGGAEVRAVVVVVVCVERWFLVAAAAAATEVVDTLVEFSAFGGSAGLDDRRSLRTMTLGVSAEVSRRTFELLFLEDFCPTLLLRRSSGAGEGDGAGVGGGGGGGV